MNVQLGVGQRSDLRVGHTWPAIDAQGTTYLSIVQQTQAHTNVWLAVGVAVGPVATAVLIGWGVIRHLLPYIRDELAASRLHMSEALTKRGNEAADDIKAARELARVQHEAIVERIEGKIGHLDERSKTHETLLRSIAAKIGVVALVLTRTLAGEYSACHP